MRFKNRPADNEKLERTERLLHFAADFTPAEPVPDNLASRALARHQAQGGTCAAPTNHRLVLACAGALAVIALLWFCLSHGSPRTSLPPEKVMVKDSVKPSPLLPAPKKDNAAYRPDDRISLPPRPRVTQHRPRHRHHRQQIARAVWKDETVIQEDVSLLVPAWIAEPDTDEDVILLTPAILNIPLLPDNPPSEVQENEPSAPQPTPPREELP